VSAVAEDIEFQTDGSTARGYLARPASGSGPGVLVVEECWGLVPQIKATADRLAADGFVALAPDWSNLTAAVQGHFAENEDFFPPDAVKALESELTEIGKDVSFTVYPGTGHAFCNEENPLGTHDEDAADTASDRAFTFLHEHLG
jgi:carboxymethylenebutenolidase